MSFITLVRDGVLLANIIRDYGYHNVSVSLHSAYPLLLSLSFYLYISRDFRTFLPLTVICAYEALPTFPLSPCHLAARARRQEDALMREGRVEGSGGGERPKETTAYFRIPIFSKIADLVRYALIFEYLWATLSGSNSVHDFVIAQCSFHVV